MIDNMAKNKTVETDIQVADFINSFVENGEKRKESFQLVSLMSKWSGFEPKMWGMSIIGFGSYHYTYDSGHEGDAPLIGFSPRKTAFSLYVYSQTNENEKLLEQLGKFKMGKSCIYVKKLEDIKIPILEQISQSSIAYISEYHECSCRK